MWTIASAAGLALVLFGLIVGVYQLVVAFTDYADWRTACRARAEEQHAWWLAGDERGLYGNYPPAEL